LIKNGDNRFPCAGHYKITGTPSPGEAKTLLTETFKGLLKDPIINFRLKIFTVTILGAVNDGNLSCKWRAK